MPLQSTNVTCFLHTMFLEITLHIQSCECVFRHIRLLSVFYHDCIMTSCGFKALVSSPCGSSKYHKGATVIIALSNCTKDITGHLQRLNTFDIESVNNEATLILARAGKLFLVSNMHCSKCAVIY